MGTNYYLEHKVFNALKRTEKVEKYYRNNGETGFLNKDYFLDNKIEMTSRGFIYKDAYYCDEKTLTQHFREKLHIGKSSCGWRFSLCAYLALNINTLEDWLDLFGEDGAVIYDEYDNVISPESMYEIIANRKSSIADLTADNCGPNAWLDTKHNLIGHDPNTYKCDEDVTYDITLNPDFC